MRDAVVICAEGVLMKPISGTPIPGGMLLYHALCEQAAVIVVFDSTPRVEAEAFLLDNNMTRHAQVVWADAGSYNIATNYRVQQMGKLQSYAVTLVIDASPSNILALIKEGFTCMQYIHAEYARPEWRPDYEAEVVPWADMSRYVSEQKRAKFADARLGADWEWDG
jgi:hypothetical protein